MYVQRATDGRRGIKDARLHAHLKIIPAWGSRARVFHFCCFVVDEIFRLQGFPPKIIGYVFQIIFYSLSGSLFSLFFWPLFFYKLLLMRQRFDSWQTFFEVTVKKKRRSEKRSYPGPHRSLCFSSRNKD